MFKNLLNARNERKLGEAIAAHDLPKMEAFLEKGVKRVDYLLMQPADFGNGSQMIPAGKFADPVDLAKKVGLQRDGMSLLARYGLGDMEARPSSARPR